MSEIEESSDGGVFGPKYHLKTGIRVVKSQRFQRFCLKCGKILPTELKRNYVHNCEKPDF